MTFRTRTAQQPSRRRVRRNDTRRGVIITLIFSLGVLIAVSLFSGVLLSIYYMDHMAPIAAVSGETITKDQVRERVALNKIRYQEQIDVFSDLRNRTKITTDEFGSLTSTITQSMADSQIYTDALTQIEQEHELRQYAAKNGITVTDQQIKDQIKVDATVPQLRHIKVVGVQPNSTSATGAVSLTDVSDAQKKAQTLLDEYKGGKKWDDVVTEAKQDALTQTGTVGDIGLSSKDDLQLDPDMIDAIFALAKVNDATTVFKGSDGIYRFATVTSIVQEYVDPNWESKVGGGAYNEFVKSEAIRKAIRTSVEDKYIAKATVQRHVEEIAVSSGYSSPGQGDEVKFNILVMAPDHSPSGASAIAQTDAKWAEAKKRAEDTLAKLKADPTQWAKIAADTTINDDATGLAARGGAAPWLQGDWFNATMSSGGTGLGMTAVGTALFKDGLTAGQILDPILETSSGYVLVQFEGRRPAPDQRIANAVFEINSGASFEDTARKYSDGADALEGGDMGWVTKYMLTGDQESAVWNTPVGGVSQIINNNGYFVYKVVDQQTRVPDAATQAKLKKVVFDKWFAELQANALIWEDSVGMAALTPTAAP